MQDIEILANILLSILQETCKDLQVMCKERTIFSASSLHLTRSCKFPASFLQVCCKHIANLACTILVRYLQVLQDGLHWVGLAAYTYFMRFNTDAISQYIVCQSSGKESCQEEFSISKNDIFFRAAPIVMVCLLPVVAILFSCDSKAFKTKFQVITAHLKSQTSKCRCTDN